MLAHRITPILNVSNIVESFAWFERLGWKKGWDWGDPPTFGGVSSGHCEIFLCQDGQGGRGKSDIPTTFGEDAGYSTLLGTPESGVARLAIIEHDAPASPDEADQVCPWATASAKTSSKTPVPTEPRLSLRVVSSKSSHPP